MLVILEACPGFMHLLPASLNRCHFDGLSGAGGGSCLAILGLEFKGIRRARQDILRDLHRSCQNSGTSRLIVQHMQAQSAVAVMKERKSQ